jgi:hypothetical protein
VFDDRVEGATTTAWALREPLSAGGLDGFVERTPPGPQDFLEPLDLRGATRTIAVNRGWYADRAEIGRRVTTETFDNHQLF